MLKSTPLQNPCLLLDPPKMPRTPSVCRVMVTKEDKYIFNTVYAVAKEECLQKKSIVC
ncbi:hypothetical protein DPMN_009685 [Dreissena polymorpha]|uniref:Uncharacterized protein n=1 Tax=Dreissena polymorpha TaxID=45954 RepID=A0A9D4RYF3_DREPO|nr:hypothetical protein DPMN_009685 [Dreissena polymorpha]